MTCLVKTGEIQRTRDGIEDRIDEIIKRMEKITEDEVILIKAKRDYKYTELLKGDEEFFIDIDEKKMILVDQSNYNKIHFIRLDEICNIKIFEKQCERRVFPI